VNIESQRRVDVAAKNFLLGLMDTFEAREQGIRRDVNPEFLHQYRIALRRSRSLVRQLDGVFSATRLVRFNRELSWISDATSDLRDIDVFILSFHSYRKKLSKQYDNEFVPFFDYLCSQRDKEFKALIRLFNSKRYQKFKKDWRSYLEAPCPRKPGLRGAQKPIEQFAARRIWSLYQKAIKQGNRIKPRSPASAFHNLRKTCKKLRYMNEFFREVFPELKFNALIRSLKRLQDNLGEYHDLDVQKNEVLRYLIITQGKSQLAPETLVAITRLLGAMETRHERIKRKLFREFHKFQKPSCRNIYKDLNKNYS
jgi:CHAD domain-containing protein